MQEERNSRRRRLAAAGGLAAVLLAPSTGWVNSDGVPAASSGAGDLEAQRRAVEELRRAIEEQKQRLDAEQRALQEQRQRLEALQRELHEQGLDRPLSAQRQSELRGGQAASQQAAPAQAAPAGQPTQQQTQQAPRTVGQAPKPAEKPPEVAPIFQQPGVLTPKGQLVLEPSLQYSYASNNRVAVIGYTIIPAITIGLIDIRAVNRSTYVATLTGRYGITNRMEVELRVPYVYRDDSTVSRPQNVGAVNDEVFNADGDGIGDVEATLRYQFNQGGLDRPYYVGTLRFKSRTGRDIFEVPTQSVFAGQGQNAGLLPTELPVGSGFYTLQPGLTVIYPSDPAVFFGSLSYLWNIERKDVVIPGDTQPSDVDAGDAVEFNFGMGLALNERASFSIGYDHTIYQKTTVNGQTPPGELSAQLGTLLLGYSYKYSKRTTWNLSLGIGVTDDAPDVQLTLRVPMNVWNR